MEDSKSAPRQGAALLPLMSHFSSSSVVQADSKNLQRFFFSDSDLNKQTSAAQNPDLLQKDDEKAARLRGSVTRSNRISRLL